MRYVAWGLIVVIVGIVALLLLSPKPSQDIEQASLSEVENTTSEETQDATQMTTSDIGLEITEFRFTGYGPGKSHPGIFETYQVENVSVNESGVPTSGTLRIETASIKTDSARLDKDLCEFENFLDCATYPTISFVLTSISETEPGVYTVVGNLTIKETQKSINFSVSVHSDGTFTSEFRVDMTEFGFGAPGIVNPEVVINLEGRAL